jgi:hypothetical protein
MAQRAVALVALLFVLSAEAASAQPVEPAQPHQHGAMPAPSWHLMQDGTLFLTYNQQGGPRGGKEIGSQNWWMGMAAHPFAQGQMTFNVMFSAEPLTTGRDGYREIFQAGEALDNIAVVDRQHPHDFLMQAAAVWRRPLARGYALTLAGAPVGEPALGPVAFMHRASAAENPTAPLAHHTLDSTHMSMGVLTAGVDRGQWQIESSIFHGREPDDNRWDLMDPGALDSWAVRGWYRPTTSLTFQVSHGFLNEPEALEAGDIRRTSVSASWNHTRGSGLDAMTLAYGRNNNEGADFNALLAESTHSFRKTTLYTRYEAVQVETDLLRFGIHAFVGGKKAHVPDDVGRVDVVQALTLGGTRRIGQWSNWDLAAGADITAYAVPAALEATHGSRPVSLHVFLRLRPPAPMGRMVDMTMTRMPR